MDVSIIIVNWNTRELLHQCLCSLYRCGNDIEYEVIVVDNASTDGSVEMVRKEFPQVELVANSENLGFARSNNIGIRNSTGRYICLINSDVVLLDDCITRLINFMDYYHSAGMAGPRILNQDYTLQPSCRRFPSIWSNFCQAVGLNRLFRNSQVFSDDFMSYWKHDSVRTVDVIKGCFWIVRCEAVDEVGLLDEDFFMYGEDLDWCKRFHNCGWDVVFCPNAEAIHIGGASSDRAPIRFYLEMQRADVLYWRKHHGRIAEAVYKLIILLRHILRVIAGALQYLFCSTGRNIVGFKLQRSIACIRWCLFQRSFLD